ncbi:hypothetical protein LCGC14_1732380, partial [marine sediment metagenome]
MTRQSAIYGGQNITQEAATCRYDKGVSFEKGQQVYLADGELVPWDYNMPKFHSQGTVEDSGKHSGVTSLRFAGTSTGCLWIRYCFELDSGGMFVISNGNVTTKQGGSGIFAMVFEVNMNPREREFLDVTQDFLSINASYSNGNISVTPLPSYNDATYEYFALEYYRNSSGIVTLLRVHKTTKAITRTVERAIAVSSQLRLMFVDTVNDYLYYQASSSVYRVSFDTAGWATPGALETLTFLTDFTDKGWPDDISNSNNAYFWDADNDVCYYMRWSSSVYSTDAAQYEAARDVWKITFDGTTFTSELIEERVIHSYQGAQCVNYCGGGMYHKAGTSPARGYSGIYHIDPSTNDITDFADQLNLNSLWFVSDLQHSLKWPVQQSINVGYAFNQANSNNFVAFQGIVGGRLFQQGLSYEAGEVHPGQDHIYLCSHIMNHLLGRNAAIATYDRFVILYVSEDVDYYYGIMMHGHAAASSFYPKSAFRVRKNSDMFSIGPIGRALTSSSIYHPASARLLLTANIGEGETVTIGSKTYTFQGTLTNVDGNVHIGANALASLANLRDAINLWSGAGTNYASSMTLHPEVLIRQALTSIVNPEAGTSDDWLEFTTKDSVTAATANALASTETSAVASFKDTTMNGAQDGGKFTLERYEGATLIGSDDITQSYG